TTGAMKHPSGYRLAIINPLTLVGKEITTILRERAFPYDKVVLLDTTSQAAGALTEIGDEPAVVTAASAVELADVDLAFFCGPAAGNREWLEGENGYIAVDLSQPTTAEDGKLAIAGLNIDSLDASDRKLVSPHPIAIPIALILHEVEKVAKVELCTASVVQPASEFNEAGVDELAKQTISVLSVHTVPKEIFDRQLAFNLYPALEHREAFIVSQIRAVTDVRAQIALSITQGTIFHGHTFSLFLKFSGEVDQAKIDSALKQNPAIAFQEGDQQFGTIDAAGKDEVLIAEVRPDPAVPGGFWMWAVCDNLRRSSALNAVLIAEKVLFGTGAN
ncbi:MAG TPA: Asd/ArgC dimerization domain-containing protein, partial [Thermoanaerobaculia bacterium]|nr:Asd/ArgC dimerization domain-containing protein [Thermoanaerobaculia bacterium]